MTKTYTAFDVLRAEHTLEPIECLGCGSNEVVYNQYALSASCQSCGFDNIEDMKEDNLRPELKKDFNIIKDNDDKLVIEKEKSTLVYNKLIVQSSSEGSFVLLEPVFEGKKQKAINY